MEVIMSKKILVIEDESEQVLAVKIRLEAGGYELISAINGEEGLNKACECKPDLILLDIFLPKMNGYQVCKRLKENPDTSNIPVLMITASGERELEKKCLAAGAEGVISKPYEVKDLLAKVQALLLDGKLGEKA